MHKRETTRPLGQRCRKALRKLMILLAPKDLGQNQDGKNK